VALTALAARLAVLPQATTDGGDAPSRVWIAQDWLASPHLITHAVWGPLHTYLIALSLAVVPDLVHAPIVLSLGLSVAACVAMNRFAATELGDERAALLVALAFAVYPVAVRNGVSVRSETPFALLLLLAMIAVARARRESGSWRDAAAGGIALTLACMLRYEGWFLIPLFGVALWKHRRRLLAFIACAAIHPVVWMIGSAVYTGDPLYSMHYSARWEREAMGRARLPLADRAAPALEYLVTIARGMTWPLTLLVLAGAAWAMHARHRLRVWLLPAVGLIAAWMVAVARGALVPKHNYTETAGVLLIPFSGLVFLRLGIQRWPARWVAIAACGVVGSVVLFSCGKCLERVGLGRLAGLSPVPRIENQGIALSLPPILVRTMAADDPALIVDHFGWGAARYVAFQTRLPRSRIFVVPGAPNVPVDVDSLSRFLRRHPRGALVLLSNSRFSDAVGVAADRASARLATDRLRLEQIRSVRWPGKTRERLTVFRYTLMRQPQ
jgi:hypothetical protein